MLLFMQHSIKHRASTAHTDKNDLVNATNCHDVSPSVDVFSPHHLLSFGSRGFDVLRGPAFCSLRYSPSPV
ncbi:hypothetical protein CP991_28135 [Escherichia coli]|nr:hypothetical protein A9P13_27465 [Escherichia coli]OZS11478.1 hypothetical protein CIG47_19395 [Escherichia coli]PAT27819.1 hypothetical protein CJ430_28075 [Klebsiella pneumoniae]PCO84891.1 hypothetical protein CP991_28135 [Escherichia coli]